MFEEGISKSTRQCLALLTKHGLLDKFYLAGGTACALRLGHRLSFDLDFFTKRPFNSTRLAQKISKIGHLTKKRVAKDTFLGELEGTKISFFLYPHPLLVKTDKFQDAEILSLCDIAAMKIDALSDRGRKRDFVDLYFIAKKLPFKDIFACYDKKYHLLKTNKFHIIKSMAFFEDAEGEPMPEMIEKVSWQQIKKFFENEALKLANKYLQ